MASVQFGTFSKRRNSTKQPTAFTDSRTVTLKESCSQDRPIFICTGNDFNYNYCIWDSKYYFIDEIISLKNNLIEIHCILDPLATYKADIIASTQFVSYSSEQTSAWLADTRIPLLQSTTTSHATGLTGILSTIGTYVITVVGESGCANYATQNTSDLDALLADIQTWESDGISNAIGRIGVITPPTPSLNPSYPTSDQRDDCFTALIDTIKDAIGKMNTMAQNVQIAVNEVTKTVQEAAVETGFIGNAYANAPQCIRSCIWVPFDFALIPAGTGRSPIKLGTFPTTVNMASCSGKAVTGSFTINIPWTYSDWRRSICEDVYLYLPLVGMVQLSGDSLTHVTQLSIDWSATYTDGVICYKVKAGSDVIGSYGASCAANYPIGIAQQASAGEVVNTALAGIEKAVGSLIDSTINPVSAAAAIGGFAGELAIAGYQTESVKKSTHISCVGGVGGGAGIGLGRDAVCFTVCHPTVIQPSDMVATMGYPTMKPMALTTLTGYCQCANAHVECAATASELNAIDMYLNTGFYIE